MYFNIGSPLKIYQNVFEYFCERTNCKFICLIVDLIFPYALVLV